MSNFPTPSYIHRLPVELLAEVFKFGANLGWLYGDSPFLLKSNSSGADFVYEPDFQVRVSHVCSHWRKIILGIPSLWTTLHLSKPAHIDRARVFLERCTPDPLPRTFLDDNDPKFDRYRLDILILTVAREKYIPNKTIIHEHLEQIFEMLTPLTLLWRSLHLRVRDGVCKAEARRALGGKCGHASRLQTLQLYHFEDFTGADDLYEATYRKPVVCFENHVPQLKHVSLIGVNLPWEISPYLAQGTLQSLELALHPDKIRPSYSVWASILRGSPHLKRLSLHYSGPRQVDAEPWSLDGVDKIRLDELEQLSLIDLDSRYLESFLACLVMPNVRRLELDLNSDDQDYTNVVRAWATNQGLGLGPMTSLTCLKLTALECDFGAFKEFLYSLTNLRHFELDFDNVCAGDYHQIWKVFVGEDGSPPHNSSSPSTLLLPKLETFKMFRLPGAQVRAIIRYREGFGREDYSQGDHDVSVATTSRYSPVGFHTSPGTLPVNVIPGINQRSKYIVKYTEQMKGEDPVLDDLVTKGCLWFPDEENTVQAEEEGYGVNMEVYEGSERDAGGAKVLRRIAPEYEAVWERKNEGSPGPAKWKIYVQPELVDEAEEDTSDEEAATDEYEEQDGDDEDGGEDEDEDEDDTDADG